MTSGDAEQMVLTVLSNLQSHMHEGYQKERKGMSNDELANSEMDEYHGVIQPIAHVRKLIEEHLL